MKAMKLIALSLAMLPISTASFALMPLPKEEIDKINKELRAAPFHVQVEVLKARHLSKPNTPLCGKITAVVRQSFKAGDRLPPGRSLMFEHCINVFSPAYPNFELAFRPGHLLETFLTYDPDRNGKKTLVRDGIMRIEKLRTQPQLDMGE